MFGNLLKNNLDFLLNAAIRKCNSVTDAQDLVQDTLLSALVYLKKGGTIEEPKAYLMTVMNRRHNDMLRKKYRQPTVVMGAGSEMLADEDISDRFEESEEAETVRREVAYLADSYRRVIVKRYFQNKSVCEIAKELALPVGTVKSRLDFGRKQIKKGFDTMETYTSNSHTPQNLIFGVSGAMGMYDLPQSLVDGDAIAQNLLILAYEKPQTVSALAKAIGIAAAYIEPVIDKLVDGQLMKRMGDGKVYTDFIIYRSEDFTECIKEMEVFTEENSDTYIKPLRAAVKKLKEKSFYSQRLERFMTIEIAEQGLYQALETVQGPQSFPDRPHGGKWVAFGIIRDENYRIPSEKTGEEEYMYSGKRVQTIREFLGEKGLQLHNYETSLYTWEGRALYGEKYSDLKTASVTEVDKGLTKLFYLIKHGISPDTVDLDVRIIEALPLLEERGFVSLEDGKTEVLVPCLTNEQYKAYTDIITEAAKTFAAGIEKPLEKWCKAHRKPIPVHLTGVPEQKRVMPYQPNAMMFVYQAVKKGIHPRDLGYPCPETIAVFD
ncbi:MAG: sigma-70 family RNA polymerase sigma factor [Ruminococcaceae bacterium]|nr:sigma-70 family RNA polymerase sigma factor [Oscillospiraceae bacterium]